MTLRPAHDRAALTQALKQRATELGFAACGVARAGAVAPAHAQAFNRWIEEGRHAGMGYMAQHRDKRLDPRLLVEGCKSIVCVALNYYPAERLAENQMQFAYYAYGKDYHDVMRTQLGELLAYAQTIAPAHGRAFCDTAPVLERYWAQQAGIGWTGRHTQLVIPGAGSYFFLGELLLDIELDYDAPMPSRCGTCRACLDACPMQAIGSPAGLDANRCLSCLTIENKGPIPPEAAREMGNRIYGCDDCQKACPWNRFAQPTDIEAFRPTETFLRMKPDDWAGLTEDAFRALFRQSAVKRAKYQGLMRNIAAARKG